MGCLHDEPLKIRSDGVQATRRFGFRPRPEIIGNLEIIIPPFDEQSRIAAFLDKRCAVIDAKIAERQRQLEKLGEYRSSVIYEYVTGKREVAA